MRKKIFTIVVMLLFLGIVGCKNNEKNKDSFKGRWIADGTQIKHIIAIVDDKPVYEEEDLPPYILDIDGHGNYTLQLKNHIYTGIYEIVEENNIYFESDESTDFTCNIKKENELECQMYATLFIRE